MYAAFHDEHSAHSYPLEFRSLSKEMRGYFLLRFHQFVEDLKLQFRMKAGLQMSSTWPHV